MNGLLRLGERLLSETRTEYVVGRLLGAGGQGEVYEVAAGGRAYALKWYYKHMATAAQEAILRNLIKQGSPDSIFLWPMDLLLDRKNGTFGYIMPLRPSNYKSIVDLMKRRAEPSFYHLCKAAFRLTNGYQQLHARGYSYRDISFGNLFLEPETGEVLICDNDNVSVNGSTDCAVYGTPRFMAPELVLGEAKPSRNTDLFSLAVLLFYMFFLNHPLEGRLEAEIRCMDLYAMTRLYGEHPVYIYDPEDTSNRPLAGYQDNAIVYYSLYPKQLKELFSQSFTVGLKSPNRRVTETQWLDVFSNMMSGIVICSACGAELFYDEDKVGREVPHVCWNCRKTPAIPPVMRIGRSRVLLYRGTRLKAHHLFGNYDIDTVAAAVVQNPVQPKLWGLRNESGQTWIYTRADGDEVSVEAGKTAAIVRGARLNFGTLTGEFL